MTDIEYTRQREWFDADRVNAKTTIVGCGGIGSFAGIALAKLGVKHLDLVDFDTVEAHNMPNQFYTPDDLGVLKVGALADQIKTINPEITVSGYNQRLEDGIPLNRVVISALDSMAARAELWKQVRMNPRCQLFLDGRLAGQYVVLYAVNPCLSSDVAAYEKTLHSDDVGLELSCTARSIIDVGFVVGSLITRAVRLHYSGTAVEKQVFHNQETLTIMKGDWL